MTHEHDQPRTVDFEGALKELEVLVDSLEKGELSLEESLSAFERGISLARTCQAALDQAEQKVRILTAKSIEAPLESFDDDG